MNKKIKSLVFILNILFGLSVPAQQEIKVDAASLFSDNLKCIYQEFGESNIQQKGYQEEFSKNIELNTKFGLLNQKAYSPEYTEEYGHDFRTKSFGDVLEDYLWDLPDTVNEYKIYIDEEYGDGDFVEKEFRNFELIDNPLSFNYDYSMQGFWYSDYPKDQLVACAGLQKNKTIEADDYYGYEFLNHRLATIGGIAVASIPYYLNTEFDLSLGKSNNLDIALNLGKDVNGQYEWSNKLYRPSKYFDYFSTINNYLVAESWFKMPLLKVNDDILAYVILTGCDEEPIYISLNSNIYFGQDSSGEYNLYCSIPFYEYIDLIEFTVPLYTSPAAPDTGYYTLDINMPMYLFYYLRDMELYWFNNEGNDANKLMKYCPIEVIDIEKEDSDYYTGHKLLVRQRNGWFEDYDLEDSYPVEPSYYSITFTDESGHSENFSLSYYDESAVSEDLYNNEDLYIEYYLIIDDYLYDYFGSGRLTITEFKYDYYYGGNLDVGIDSVKVSNNLRKNQYFDFYSERSAVPVYLKGEIKNTRLGSISQLKFSFAYDKGLANRIRGIESVIFAVEFANGSKGEYIYTVDGEKEFIFGKGFRYIHDTRCTSELASEDYLYVNSFEHVFNSSLNLTSLINLLKGFDFTFDHKINATLSSKKYHDCKIVKVNYAYCNFIVDSGTYVKGGIGDTGIHAEYDEDGNLYGIYDKDGKQVSNLFKDEVTGHIVDEFGNAYFDEESMQVEMKDAYEFFQEKKENAKNGITNSINDLIDSIKGFFSSVIIILLVGLGIYVVIKVVKKKRG